MATDNIMCRHRPLYITTQYILTRLYPLQKKIGEGGEQHFSHNEGAQKVFLRGVCVGGGGGRKEFPTRDFFPIL